MPKPPTDKPTPHWILPFAASLSEPCQHTLAQMDQAGDLPNLRQLLTRLHHSLRLEGDEYTLSMPHERVLAREMGWPSPEQEPQPWAAWWAREDGLNPDPAQCWGLMSPGHWLLGRDHLTLLDPASLGLDETASRALLEALRPLFESDGWTLVWGAPTRWYVAHHSLSGLPCASLDRVIGRNPDVWLTGHPQARLVRRLQSEVQMLLYQHPINEAREAQGQATINSFWLSGCGQPPPPAPWPAHLRLHSTLRQPLLAEDMPAWRQAWAELDATVLKQALAHLDAGEAIALTLCGERHALTLSSAQGQHKAFGWAPLWQGLRRLAGRDQGPQPGAWLAQL